MVTALEEMASSAQRQILGLYASLPVTGFNPHWLKAVQREWAPMQQTYVFMRKSSSLLVH